MNPTQTEWTAEVFITLKPSVLDPQGNTVQAALHSMGYTDLAGARLGKYFTLRFAGTLAQAEVERQVKQMCDKLLVNPVIERYRFQLTSGAQESK
jgi:phosphoribosylformylglycinamidine synthase subunit PurS